MGEIWKNIQNYEGYYEISNLGNIRSLEKTIYNKNGLPRKLPLKNLKLSISTKGYLKIGLSKNDIKLNFELHRLLAIHFIKKTSEDFNIVNHIDGNILNNNLDNLEWTTLRENTTHGILKKSYTSKYINVYKNKNSKKWSACIGLNNKNHYLGSFENEIEANEEIIKFKENNNIINKYSNNND